MISKTDIENLFEYKEGRLFWKKRKGNRAGCICKKEKYVYIRINKKTYLEHRLVFCMFKGYFPKLIDHISDDLTVEGVKCNKIKNLRDVSKAVNQQKSKLRGGSSKYRGVSYCKINKKWRCATKRNGKFINLGYFEEEDDAARRYNVYVKEHYGQHAGINLM